MPAGLHGPRESRSGEATEPDLADVVVRVDAATAATSDTEEFATAIFIAKSCQWVQSSASSAAVIPNRCVTATSREPARQAEGSDGLTGLVSLRRPESRRV